MVKKDGVAIVNNPYLLKMFPRFYHNCFEKQLKRTQYLTLQILVFLLQAHKYVSIERLATVLPYPVLFESRRRSIQRFLIIPKLKIELLWFPIIKHIVRSYFKTTRTLTLTIDRTQWRDKNIFVISLIWDKRALPIFWQILPKKGSSNLKEQQKLIRPALDLFKNYKIIILGDREFGSVKLGNWLCERKVMFALRVKQERYIKQEGQEYKRLSDLGLIPGTSFYLTGVQVTKQKGFGKFDIAGYYKRKWRDKSPDEPWYLLTNLGSLTSAISAYKRRSGIEAMFKDCKSGGYNLEKSHAADNRLISLILIIAIAYSCAGLKGRKIKNLGIQKYLGRLKELKRMPRRHSSFWIGLYGQLWIGGIDFCSDLVVELMRLIPNKLPNFQRGLRAAALIQTAI